MDALYKAYAKIRQNQLANLTSENLADTSAQYYTIERLRPDSNRQEELGRNLDKRYLDLNAAVGLLTFLYSQLDVVTAMSVLASLEKRAQYDPQFRTSFPTFLRRNSWFL